MSGLALLRRELAERDADVAREFDASAAASTKRLDQVLVRRFEARASGFGLAGPAPGNAPSGQSTGWTSRTPRSGVVAAVLILGVATLGAAAVLASGDSEPSSPRSAPVTSNGAGSASDEPEPQPDVGPSLEQGTSAPILVDAETSASGLDIAPPVTELDIVPVSSTPVELEPTQPTVAPADGPVELETSPSTVTSVNGENTVESPPPTGQPCSGDGFVPGEPTAVGTSDIDFDRDGLADSVLLYASESGPVLVVAFGAGGVAAVDLPDKPVGNLTGLARVVTVHSGDEGRQLAVVVDDLDDGATWWTIVVAVEECTPMVLPIEVESGAFSGVSFAEGSERFGLLCPVDQPAQPLVVVDVESNAYGLSFDESNFELVVNGEGDPSSPGCWQ